VATFANGTTVTLTATPTDRSRFAGWSGDCSGKSTCVLSMTVDHAVTATFARRGAASPTCAVPRVVGMSLAKARTKIRRAHCSVGRINKKFSPRAKKGKVLVQGPKRGTRLRTGARVNLVVGKGPRRA
jgi:beta-lactam-binding protein with PASTA domain